MMIPRICSISCSHPSVIYPKTCTKPVMPSNVPSSVLVTPRAARKGSYVTVLIDRNQ